MCRGQLPGWQRFLEQEQGKGGFEFSTIALDTQGPKVVRPWVERAGGVLRTVVDQSGLLARSWGFKVVPNAWVIDEAGVLRYQKVGGFHIEHEEDRAAILEALRQAPATAPAEPASASVDTLLEREVGLLSRGEALAALETWFQVAEADMENMIVRKQIWYLLHPERFRPEIDTAWQREQREREAALGVRAANPIPEGWTAATR